MNSFSRHYNNWILLRPWPLLIGLLLVLMVLFFDTCGTLDSNKRFATVVCFSIYVLFVFLCHQLVHKT